jgi:hypothetical protein
MEFFTITKMGQIPTGTCAKCDGVLIPQRDKCWTKYCEKCYSEMWEMMSDKSCTRCRYCKNEPRYRHPVINTINGMELKGCSDCHEDKIPYISERYYCDQCLENRYYRNPTKCQVCSDDIYHAQLRYCEKCDGVMRNEEPDWLPECKKCYESQHFKYSIVMK